MSVRKERRIATPHDAIADLEIWNVDKMAVLVTGLYDDGNRPTTTQAILVVKNIALFRIKVRFWLQPAVAMMQCNVFKFTTN